MSSLEHVNSRCACINQPVHFAETCPVIRSFMIFSSFVQSEVCRSEWSGWESWESWGWPGWLWRRWCGAPYDLRSQRSICRRSCRRSCRRPCWPASCTRWEPFRYAKVRVKRILVPKCSKQMDICNILQTLSRTDFLLGKSWIAWFVMFVFFVCVANPRVLYVLVYRSCVRARPNSFWIFPYVSIMLEDGVDGVKTPASWKECPVATITLLQSSKGAMCGTGYVCMT